MWGMALQQLKHHDVERNDGPHVAGEPNGAGVPSGWLHYREFAAQFGHGHTPGAARMWMRRQLDAGLVREYHMIGRDRYVTLAEVERFKKRTARALRRARPPR